MNKTEAAAFCGGYFLLGSSHVNRKQWHQLYESCKRKHVRINLSFSLHVEKNLRNQFLLGGKCGCFGLTDCRRFGRDCHHTSWGNLLVFHFFSHILLLERQRPLNRCYEVRCKDEKRAFNFQPATFGSGSEMYIQADEGSVAQSTETLLYDSVCDESELLQAPAEADNYLLSGYGWKVRDFDAQNENDWEAIADIQAKAFYTPFSIFNDLLFIVFKAEVLSALVYKIRHSVPKRYTCLLAEPVEDELNLDAVSETKSKVVGVVDLTALAERDIVKHLHGVDEYLYLGGLAVDNEYRRKGVGTLLLQASDLKALAWGFKYIVLHAYEDDAPARRLYTRAGFQLICKEPLWTSKWLGKRRRVAMAKEIWLMNVES